MIGVLPDEAGAAELQGCPPERVVSWEQLTDLSASGRRFLRGRLGGRDVVLYLANESAAPLLNHIVLLTAAFRPRRLEIVRHAGGVRRRVRLHHVAGALWSLAAATVAGALSLARFVAAAEIRRRQLQREGPERRHLRARLRSRSATSSTSRPTSPSPASRSAARRRTRWVCSTASPASRGGPCASPWSL